MQREQHYGNHKRYLPLYHFIVVPLFVLHFLATLLYAFRHPGAKRNWWPVSVVVAPLPLLWAARVVVLFLFVGLMWVIHAIDAIKPTGTSVLSTGIVPRTWDGLKGIPVAPFIHENWDHLIANTLPLLILGALVVMRGVSEFVF